MTVLKALELINVDQIEHRLVSFSTCHAWYFTHAGIEYRLCEWEGDRLFVETVRVPRTELDRVSL